MNGFTGVYCNEVLNDKKSVFYYIFLFLLGSLLVGVFISVVYFYFNQEKLPIKVQVFLKNHARWCLRYEPIFEES